MRWHITDWSSKIVWICWVHSIYLASIYFPEFKLKMTSLNLWVWPRIMVHLGSWCHFVVQHRLSWWENGTRLWHPLPWGPAWPAASPPFVPFSSVLSAQNTLVLCPSTTSRSSYLGFLRNLPNFPPWPSWGPELISLQLGQPPLGCGMRSTLKNCNSMWFVTVAGQIKAKKHVLWEEKSSHAMFCPLPSRTCGQPEFNSLNSVKSSQADCFVESDSTKSTRKMKIFGIQVLKSIQQNRWDQD